MSEQMTQPQVAIIILNWNNPDDTLACLRSVAALDYPADRLKIIVVDNDSTDDSVAIIRDSFPNVEILETGENLGYAGGNNAGIHRALAMGADLVCILNNDITVEPDFLDSLLEAMQSQPDVSIVTPLVAEQAENGGRVWALGASVNWRTAQVTRRYAGESIQTWHQQAPFEVDVASGAAMLVKRDVFGQAGLIDESFFLYFEETDWCLRIRKAGFRILAVPSSVVWHRVSATLGTTSPLVDYYMLRNHLRFIACHWHQPNRCYLQARVTLRNLLTVAAYTAKPHGGRRIPNRNARLLALRDALLGRWGKMGVDVAAMCKSRYRE